jgi:arylsulfatase A-like enzyme
MTNVILLTIDALRKDMLGCYGCVRNLSPFIDSLQQKSLVFNKMQSCGPYTQASFPGILTSSYFLDYGHEDELSLKKTLVSEPLKDAGMTTAAFHSNLYLSDLVGWNRGWNVFYDSMEDEVEPQIPYIRGQGIIKKVDNWLSSYVASDYRPFFAWIHFMDVHEPYLPEKKYVEMVDSSLSILQDDMYSLFEKTLLKRDVSDESKVKMLKRLYEVHVREVDNYVEEFFHILEKLNILKDSIVIITSDHGDEFNEHGGLSHDAKMYSELIDLPFLIFDPDSDGKKTCDTLVSNIDIPPTILHLFGLEPEADFQGHSLLPTDSYPKKGCHGEALYREPGKAEDSNRDVYYYREEDLKITYKADIDVWEMYDLDKDPSELKNIIDSSLDAERLKKMIMPRVRRWQRKI